MSAAQPRPVLGRSTRTKADLAGSSFLRLEKILTGCIASTNPVMHKTPILTALERAQLPLITGRMRVGGELFATLVFQIVPK
jgi:hypothetical protein